MEKKCSQNFCAQNEYCIQSKKNQFNACSTLIFVKTVTFLIKPSTIFSMIIGAPRGIKLKFPEFASYANKNYSLERSGIKINWLRLVFSGLAFFRAFFQNKASDLFLCPVKSDTHKPLYVSSIVCLANEPRKRKATQRRYYEKFFDFLYSSTTNKKDI